MRKIALFASAVAFGVAIGGAAMAQQSTHDTHSSTINQTRTSTESTTTSGSNNPSSQTNSNVVASGNSLGNGNNQSKNTTVSKENGNEVASNDAVDSNNNKSRTYNTSVQADNDGNSSTATTVELVFSGPMTLQDLSGVVTGDHGQIHGATGSISLNSGASDNFAGVQTASLNTGIQSVVQSSTAVAATSTISFGAN